MSGLFSQVGFAQETTYGTAVTVDRFVPLVDESLTRDIARMESKGIIAGARLLRSEQWAPGRISVAGDVGLEWFQQNLALLFRNMLGSITSSATAGIATHTATLGSLTGQSFTTQIGKPTVTGTVIPFTYAGCKVRSWSLAVKTGEIATLGLTLLAQTESIGVALAAASYLTGAAKPYHYVQGGVTISSSAVCVRELNLSGENPLADDRECIGQAYLDEPLENDLRMVSGTANLEFTSTAQYQRYLDGIEVPIVLSMSAAASAQASVTMNARFDGKTPGVSGRGLITVETPFKIIGTTSDASGLTAVIKNSQTTP
jgi:hypothetical protein